MVSRKNPRSSRIIAFAALAICLAWLVYRFVMEGTFAYVAADWRRILIATFVTLVGTIIVVAAQRQAALMRQTSHSPRSFLIFGVVGGAVVGLSDIFIASILWHFRGEPYGYFRDGWSGVFTSALLTTAGGGAAGIGFGGVLLFIESRFQRVIQFRLLAIAMLLITLGFFGLAYLLMFHLGWPHPFLFGHGIVFISCSVAAAVLSAAADRGGRRPPSLPPQGLGSITCGDVQNEIQSEYQDSTTRCRSYTTERRTHSLSATSGKAGGLKL
jgi:hypothetical protein